MYGSMICAGLEKVLRGVCKWYLLREGLLYHVALQTRGPPYILLQLVEIKGSTRHATEDLPSHLLHGLNLLRF